jgi:hypothetical protein
LTRLFAHSDLGGRFEVMNQGGGTVLTWRVSP